MQPTCGQMLARLRIAKGMTQEDFGFVAGWGTAVQRHLEHGKTKFTANEHLARLMKVELIKDGDRYYKWFMRLLSRVDDLPDPDEVEVEVKDKVVEEEEELSPLQQEWDDFWEEDELRDKLQDAYFRLIDLLSHAEIDKSQSHFLNVIGENVEQLETMDVEELREIVKQDLPLILKGLRITRRKEKVKELKIKLAQSTNIRTPPKTISANPIQSGIKRRTAHRPNRVCNKPVPPSLDNQPGEDTMTDGLPSEG